MPIHDSVDLLVPGNSKASERRKRQEITDLRLSYVKSALSDIIQKLNIERNNVCLRWRKLSLSTGKLRAHLDFDSYGPEKISRLIERAGDALFDIVALRSTTDALKYRSGPTCVTAPNWFGRSFKYDSRFSLGGDGESERLDSNEAQYLSSTRGPLPSTIREQRRSTQVSNFHTAMQRAASLRVNIGPAEQYLCNSITMSLPMPHLQSFTIVDPPEDPTVAWDVEWFSGICPSLRELDLEFYHPQWDDSRILSNLVNLRLSNPSEPLNSSQLLRILRRCPTLEFLDVVHGLSVPLNNNTDLQPVKLLSLWYLHIETIDETAFTNLLSNIICPMLETLILCAPGLTSLQGTNPRTEIGELSIGNFQPLLSKTTSLKVLSGEDGYLTVIGETIHNQRPEIGYMQSSSQYCKPPGPSWSFRSRVDSVRPNFGSRSTVGAQSRSVDFPVDKIGIKSGSTSFLDRVEATGLRIDQIEIVELRGKTFGDGEFYRNLLSRCFRLKKLHFSYTPRFDSVNRPIFKLTWNPTRALHPKPLSGYRWSRYDENLRILTETVTGHQFPWLEELQINLLEVSSRRLVDWLESRPQAFRKLKKIAVDTYRERNPQEPAGFDVPIEDIKVRLEALLTSSTDQGDRLHQPASGLVWRRHESAFVCPVDVLSFPKARDSWWLREMWFDGYVFQALYSVIVRLYLDGDPIVKRTKEFLESRQEELSDILRSLLKEQTRDTVSQNAISNLEAALPLVRDSLKTYRTCSEHLEATQAGISDLILKSTNRKISMQAEEDSCGLYEKFNDLLSSYTNLFAKKINEQVEQSHDEARRLQDLLRDMEMELDGWKSFHSFVANSLKHLISNKARVEMEIQIAKHVLHPIRCVPSQVWIQVFGQIIDIEFGEYMQMNSNVPLRSTPHILSHVCQLWRKIVMQESRLWRFVVTHASTTWSQSKYELFKEVISQNSQSISVVANLSQSLYWYYNQDGVYDRYGLLGMERHQNSIGLAVPEAYPTVFDLEGKPYQLYVDMLDDQPHIMQKMAQIAFINPHTLVLSA
ncbi:hypothetical protein FRC17_009135, partial [Serendipita sp. 399]